MSRKIGGLDLETTGLDVGDGHRIIEVALLTYLPDGTLVDRYVQRVNPERAIDPDAQRVHGISFADLVGEPVWAFVAPEVQGRLEELDELVIHNAGFDAPFLDVELRRMGLTPPNLSVFCTMENARWATPDGKLPKLQELCFALGVEYDPAAAHAAEYDVSRMMECYFRATERGFFKRGE